MNKLLGIAIIVGAPLLLWFDVWLAFQFGYWINEMAESTTGEGGFMLGIMAFGVLVGIQVGGILMIGDQ